MRNSSPFPGMDPWREAHWGGMHHRIMQYSCDQIESQMPPGLPIDQAYRRGRYAMMLDYSKPPEPPLPAEDAAWAPGLIAD